MVTTPLAEKAVYGNLSTLEEMSEYYRRLDSIAQGRYLEKLRPFGLEEKDNPRNGCNFVDDMTKWPSAGVYNRQHCSSGRVWRPSNTFKVAMLEKLRCGHFLVPVAF